MRSVAFLRRMTIMKATGLDERTVNFHICADGAKESG